jgi:hypothetical protein
VRKSAHIRNNGPELGRENANINIKLQIKLTTNVIALHIT